MSKTDAQRLQIKQILEKRYFSMIGKLPLSYNEEWHHQNRLSRSLAAFTIERLADVAPSQAAYAVSDGGGDNGVDAVHFDRAKNRLWVVQAKIGDSLDSGKNALFCDGLKDLQSSRFDRFHKDFKRFHSDINDALATDGVRIVACIVYLGEQLGTHIVKQLDQLAMDINQFDTHFEWKKCDVFEVHSWLTNEQKILAPEIELTLENWNGIKQPRRSFFGLITAEQLFKLYEKHGKSLFERNIRYYLGSQSVNSAISITVRENPTELFFLNNGLTASCTQITQPPGAKQERSIFRIKGFSIVNGAQTVGSIVAVAASEGKLATDAKVLITLIEIGDSEDQLGQKITSARNTQNTVKGLDYVALDPNQERLRRELAISGITYHYRPSAELLENSENSITFERAAIALACTTKNTQTVVTAKRELGQLYDRGGRLYTELIRDNLSGVFLCRAVRIFEYLDGIFSASEAAETATRRRMFYRHGRYFIVHILARRMYPMFEKAEITLSADDKLELSRNAIDLAELIYNIAERTMNNSGYLHIFRTLTDAEPLAQEVMAQLNLLDKQRR